MPGFTFDPRLKRFRDAAGKLVANVAVRDAMRGVADGAARSLRTIADGYVGGATDQAAFLARAKALLKSVHTAATAAASGGWRRVDAKGWAATGRRLRAAYQKLADLELQFRRGEVTGPQMAARVAMLARGANGTFEARSRELAGEVIRERRALGITARHCGECIDLAALGWQPAGTLPACGDCQCLDNCLCSFEYEMGAGAEAPEQVAAIEAAATAESDRKAAAAKAAKEAEIAARKAERAKAREAARIEAEAAKAERARLRDAARARREAAAARHQPDSRPEPEPERTDRPARAEPITTRPARGRLRSQGDQDV
jgi:hypothetical protein